MRILIIGGHGTIGRPVRQHLETDQELIIAGRTGGDVKVDISDTRSIEEMFREIGELDAILCIAGEAKWGDFKDLTEEDFHIGLKSKLMGQVNLVRYGMGYLRKNGSITLSTGILADDPVVKTSSAAMVNGGIHSFVQAVALEMENGIRVNAVSLGLVEDAYEKYKEYFQGHDPIPMKKVVNAYIRSLKGKDNGRIIRIYG